MWQRSVTLLAALGGQRRHSCAVRMGAFTVNSRLPKCAMTPAESCDSQNEAAVGIGMRLREERQRLALRQGDLAAALGVAKTTQVNYEAGRRLPDAGYLAAARRQGLDVIYVLSGTRPAAPIPASSEDAPEDALFPVPLYQATASAGNGCVNESPAEYKVGVVSVSRDWLHRRKLGTTALCAIAVRGTSMQPVLADGDLVVLDRSERTPRTGFVYVIRHGDELLVKYLAQLPDGVLRVSSANPSFAAYDIDLARSKDVEVVGRVVMSMHDW